MEPTSVQRLARVLRFLITLTYVCNLAALVLVPALVIFSPNVIMHGLEGQVLHLLGIRPYGEDDIFVPILFAGLSSWGEIWQHASWVLHTMFLTLWGICTAVILRQGRRILDTVLEGNPFQAANAHSLRRAAVCCWTISGAALARLIGELLWAGDTEPLYTYNALFCPMFLMAGLLFLVMSALFRQAAELREDRDLTI